MTFDDYIDRIKIQDVLSYAGYKLNRRDGIRYPSYVAVDDRGVRIRGDKFIVMPSSKTCFHPPQIGSYNIISLITNFSDKFPESANGLKGKQLVDAVCHNILCLPQDVKNENIIEPRKETPPFKLSDYLRRRFIRDDVGNNSKFLPYFESRGIDLRTQRAFADNILLATHASRNDKTHFFTNLSFPMRVPGESKIVGFEERGRPRLDGSSGYKGKAMGSNSSEGLWIASPHGTDLRDASDVYWFESAYDAMAYYQLHATDNSRLDNAVFLSTGGTPSVNQFSGVLREAGSTNYHLCFDNDEAGQQYADNFLSQLKRLDQLGRLPQLTTVVEIPEGGCKDWNDELLLRLRVEEERNSSETGEELAEGMDMDADGDIEISESHLHRRSRFYMLLLTLLFCCQSALGQIVTTNPGEYAILSAGNLLINDAVTSEINAEAETALLQNAMAGEFTKMKQWEQDYNKYLKTANGYASALKAASHIYDDGVRILISLDKLRQAVVDNPQGVVATIDMNNLYMETITEMVTVYSLLNDAVAKGGSENMLTGAERSKTLWALEDKLVSFSHKLQLLYMSIRHYRMSDVWNRATAGMIERDRASVARQSLSHWKRYAKETNNRTR